MPAVRFGMVSGDASLAGPLASVCEALGARLGVVVRPVVFSSFAELRARLAAFELEIAWSPPVPAVQLELAGKVHIAAGVHREGGSSYSSALFCLATSDIARVEDLKGARIAWVDPDSAAGHILPKLKLATLGVREGSYQEWFAGTHEFAVRDVFTGRADAAATHVSFAPVRGNVESAGWLRAGHRMEDVRILATAGPIPPDVIVVSRSAPELVQEQLGDALIDVSTDATSRDAVESLFAGRGFVLVGRYQYDDLRKLVSARES